MRLLLAFFLLLSLPCFAQVGASNYARTTADGRGAVASVNPLATQAGLDAFANGGNAVDAALAIAFTLGVVDSHNSGIGGGCFVVVHLADGRILAIDGREMAPAKAQRDMFIRDGKADPALSKTGALAVGVPGSVAALFYLQQTAGKLKFADVLLPAADIAAKGFPVDTVFAKRLSGTADKMVAFKASADIFLSADGKPLAAGDILVQKDLAETYRRLAQQGPDFFYRGAFAKAVETWMKANGGIVTADDFANYQMVLRTPVRTQFQGYEVVGFPPPSSGGVMVAEILNILAQFELSKLSEADRYHLMIEAMKLAFADRAHWLGDPDFAKVPRGLVGTEYAKALAKRIAMDKAAVVEKYSVPPAATELLFGKHTTHIAAADKDGNWVAITTTLNTSFGSKVVVPGTGVLLNNQMDDFSAQPGVANAFGLLGAEANSVQGRKRPLSSMSPTLVLHEGKPILTLGAAGGPTIITQVLQTLVNTLSLELPLPEAMAAVRVHHQWQPDLVFIDDFAAPALTESLAKKGHQLKVWPPFGATQAIGWDGERLMPVTEPRLTSGKR